MLKNAEAVALKEGVKTNSKMAETIGHRVSKLILEEAKAWQADLIVMGTHGLRGIERLVVGSDAETVIRKKMCIRDRSQDAALLAVAKEVEQKTMQMVDEAK